MLTQLIVSGLATGCLYALVALGLVIVYKASNVLNFAQGDMAMVSTFVTFTLLETLHIPFFWAVLLAIVGAFLLGALFEICLLRPVKHPTPLGLIIITVGAQQILYGVAGWIWGYDTKAFPSLLSDLKIYRFGALVISEVNLWILIASVLLMLALLLFFRYTRLGIAIRAMSQNLITAKLMGVSAHWTLSLTWGIASVLGAVAGILIAPITFLDPNMMLNPLLKAFAAATLGGMNSFAGAVVGGGSLGILENLVGGYLTPELKESVAFLIIILVLCVRPSGLLGRHYKHRV
ncbi:MAG: branched-chain amino acid ABC transporter permease [candidate division NC10 bacterium]|nr:branched-chain amino acid ABC transporter permease [candidate division NC10 bacterium]